MELRKRLEIEHYDREAKHWQTETAEDKWKTDVHFVRHDLFLSYRFCHEWLKTHSASKSILDYGCGTGIHSIVPAQSGATVCGIDLSEESLEIARCRAARASVEDRVKFLKMDCESLEFEDNSFDIIFDGGVFSSIDLKKALPELARVLRPEGALLGIETFGHNPLANAKRKLNTWRKKRTSWASAHIMKRHDFELARRYFESVEVRYFHLFSLFVLPFVRLPGGSFLFKLLDRADGWFLTFPFLQRFAFKVVFIFSKPKK